ncbi:MAG: DUF47 domain-containing protein [Candidatus Hydrothermarchaeota archaeon]
MSWRSLVFGKPQDKEILDRIQKHMKMVEKAVEELKNVVDVFCDEDFDKMGEMIEKVNIAEAEADDLRREIESLLREGKTQTDIRENLFKLIERLDEVADAAKTAVRMFQVREKSLHSMCIVFSERCIEISKELKSRLLSLVDSVLETVKTLRESINYMNTDMHQAAFMAREVDRKEEEVDEIEHETLKMLLHAEGELDVLSIIQLREIISQIGNVADKAEDASDIVSIIAVRYTD